MLLNYFNNNNNIVNLNAILKADRILSQASRLSLARLLPYTIERNLSPGDTIYRAGNSARELFLVLDGEVKLVGKSGYHLSLHDKWIGQEAATNIPHYLTDAVTTTQTKILAISKSGLNILFNLNPKLKGEFYISLMESFGGDLIHEQLNKETSPKISLTDNWQHLIGWVFTVILPAIILFIGLNTNIPNNTVHFLAILAAAFNMWNFNLVDEYLPIIFILFTTLAMDLVPINIALSGLSSQEFWLALSMFGLGNLVIFSGLIYRLFVLIMFKLPERPFWHNVTLLIVGFFITPLIPSINLRISIMTPLINDIMEVTRCFSKGTMATALIISAFLGLSLISSLFLTGQSFNLFILGALPEIIREQFNWLQWIGYAAVAGIIIIILNVLLLMFIFSDNEYSYLTKQQIATQLNVLGNLQQTEWAAIISMIFFGIALITTFLHKIITPWLALAVFYGILLFKMLNKTEFNKEIDWSFLIYVGGMISINNIFVYLNLDKLLINYLPWLGEIMLARFYVFLTILTISILIMRIVLSTTTTILIMTILLIPLANHIGINPWVVGFSIIILGEIWFFPYQCPYYHHLNEIIANANEKIFLQFNAYSNLVKLAALYISVYYWNLLGLL